jgi:hypothetical protein
MTFGEVSNRLVFGAGDSHRVRHVWRVERYRWTDRRLITAVNTIGKVTVENSAKYFKILRVTTPTSNR